MKTLDKKNLRKRVTYKKEPHKHLIEDLTGHQLLSESAKAGRAAFHSDLIQLKREKDRKRSSSSLLISSISVCISFLVVIGMFEWKSKEDNSMVELEVTTENFDDLLDIPQTEQIQKPPVKMQAPLIIEVADEEIIEDIDIDLDIEMTEDTRIEEVVFDQPVAALEEEKAEEIFTIVEQKPAPVGGMSAFYSYVGDNLKYPEKAARMSIEGRVFVEFVVERDGSLTDIKVVKGIGGGCDEEAVRVLSQAPDWNPGKQRGRAVRVRMIMPIVFKLLHEK